jgi:RHS repeat-associated protein
MVVPLQNIQQINPMPYPTFCNLGPGGNETDLFFYHPDHLGSTGVITDNYASVTQGFLYAPFGELMYEHDPSWQNNRVPKYAFNAKELDEENGMYYYSARYYAPPTFISRDPMFEDYPSISPYTYCANNPVNVIDPTGEDIWTISEDGAISCQKNTKIDRIDVIDANGNTIKGTEASCGTIKQHTLKGIDYFEIQGDALAKETFENIANNTKIEWTHAKVGTENSNKNIIGTSHDKNSTSVGTFLRNTEYTLKEITHNHPTDNPYPSDFIDNNGKRQGDVPNAEIYKKKNNNTILQIYTKSYGYSQYDELGTKDERLLKPSCPETIITPKQP